MSVLKKGEPEKYFKEAGAVWVRLYGELLPIDFETGEVAEPSFWDTPSEKKSLKEILISLRERATKKNIIWTKDVMQERLEKFILAAWKDDWLSKKFMLRFINQNKTLIFNNQITPKKDGKANERLSKSSGSGNKSSGAEQLIGSLREKIRTDGSGK
jgi:hypothetical protein